MNKTELTYERKEALRRYWDERSLSELVDFIEKHYHMRARNFISGIVEQIDIIQKDNRKESSDLLIPLKHLRNMLTDDMEKHTLEEEEILFPYIRALESGAASNETLLSLGRIHNEHNQIIDTLVRLKLETTLERLPKSYGEYYHSLYEQLAEFLADLQEHVFLEDEILFLEALELEKRKRSHG